LPDTEGDTMKKILIATDGSPSAREAVAFGLEIAAEQGAEVVFVHVIPTADVLPMNGFGLPAALPHPLTAADRAPLDEAAKLASEQGITAHTQLLTGTAVDEIVAYADSLDAGLIVVGSRAHGAVASALLGGVSQGILHEARRPVLVVRGARPREAALTAAASA
jgi:nucleotide-binding universal stress UspA family protein